MPHEVSSQRSRISSFMLVLISPLKTWISSFMLVRFSFVGISGISSFMLVPLFSYAYD
jgi:hypothetical protein